MSGQGRPVVIGYDWRQRLLVTAAVPVFPVGASVTAHVRLRRTDAQVKTTLTTSNGGITRISDNEVELLIPASVTQAIPASTPSIQLDFVRTDLPPPGQHLGFILTVPVILPVTRL